MAEAEHSTRIALSTFNLLQAPQDDQRSILLALNNRELVLYRRVCRALTDLIKNDIALQYKLEFALFGRIDGTRSVPVIDRLAALREHRARFQAGDHPLTRAPRLPLGFLPTRSDMVVGNSASLWRPASTFSGIDDLKIVHTVQGLGLEGYQTGSCAVDLSQDLLVFSRRVRLARLHVGVECWIYSLKEGQPHPLASRSQIQSKIDHQRSHYLRVVDDIQVLGTLIAWNNLDGGQREMMIINWKTGVAVWHLITPETRWHCCLISQTHVVVAAPHSLKIYSFDPHRESPPAASLTDHPALCILELPEWSDNVLADQNWSSSYIHFPPPPGPDDSPLYRHDPDLTVLTIYYEFNVRVSTTPTSKVVTDPYAIFIPISTLKARITMPSQPFRAVPWDDWGPAGTRVVRFAKPCTLSPMGCSVAAMQKHWTGPDATLKILVFDVHPLAKQPRERLKDAKGLLCTLRETPAFAERIRTTFPFEFTVRHEPLGMRELYSPVVLMEDGLMLVTPSTSS